MSDFIPSDGTSLRLVDRSEFFAPAFLYAHIRGPEEYRFQVILKSTMSDEERAPLVCAIALPANHRFTQPVVNQGIPVEHLNNDVQPIPTDDIPEEYVHHTAH